MGITPALLLLTTNSIPLLMSKVYSNFFMSVKLLLLTFKRAPLLVNMIDLLNLIEKYEQTANDDHCEYVCFLMWFSRRIDDVVMCHLLVVSLLVKE